MKRSLAITIIAASVLPFTGGCGDDNHNPGVPNPAAKFCEEHGGTTSGPEPMCKLPDGSVVDAWEYFRSEGPAS
jgi:putative hemolysin